MSLAFPSGTATTTPNSLDRLLFSDISDSNDLKKATIVDVILAGLGATTTDYLPVGANNLYMTVAEKAKLAGIQAMAEQNVVDSVNGQLGAIILTQDDIGDGITYKQTHNDYTNADKVSVGLIAAHIADTLNPHSTTKTQVGLGNVTDDAQLKRSAGDFNSFTLLATPTANDVFLLEDSLNAYAKRKTTLAGLATTVSSLISPISGWVQNSLDVSGGKIQLDNDLAIPADNQFYGKVAGVKGWHFLTNIGFQQNQPISTLIFEGQNIPSIPAANHATMYLDKNNGQVMIRKPNGAIVEIENAAGPCVGCFTCNDVALCIATSLAVQAAISLAIDTNPYIQASICALGCGGGGMTCTDVQNCIEAFTSLDLSGVNVTLGIVGGNISFLLNTTIDWTNTTNTGTQNFGDTYIANYDGSILNIYNNATLNITESTYNSTNNTYNYEGDTINYVSVTENYDVDSVINNYGETNNYGENNFYGDTNIENLNVTNLTVVGGGSIAVRDVPVIMNTASHNAAVGEFILVTYNLGNSIINLPDPALCEGGKVRVKKFTGEDVREITILPHGLELIDGYTGATMNINRTMFTFTAIDGNRYLGD